MTKQDILDIYAETGWNIQDLMDILDRESWSSRTNSFDGSLKVYQKDDLVVMVSSDGVEFFRPEK